ncbi:MAG TPA: hypothetical protein VM427_08420 [Patescibacteria group bacterium]|nr:hypothetical protein [Patescibacteria group bacterium]
MTTADLDRIAGLASWVALVALVLSGIALVLFFGGAGEFWGPVNDALIVVVVLALLPPVVAIARLAGERGGPWVTIVTVAAIAGLLLIAVGQSLLIIGRLSLEGSFVTGGIGVVPVIAWIVLVAALALGAGILPASTGWLAVATLVTIVLVSLAAAVTRGPLLWIGGVGLLVAISAWLASLATTFGSNATSA